MSKSSEPEPCPVSFAGGRKAGELCGRGDLGNTPDDLAMKGWAGPGPAMFAAAAELREGRTG